MSIDDDTLDARPAANSGARHAPSLIVRVLSKSDLLVTRVACAQAGFGRTEPVPPDDAFLVALQLMDVKSCELWLDGRAIKLQPAMQGEFGIVDLNRRPVVNLEQPFDGLNFRLPRGSAMATYCSAWTVKRRPRGTRI